MKTNNINYVLLAALCGFVLAPDGPQDVPSKKPFSSFEEAVTKYHTNLWKISIGDPVSLSSAAGLFHECIKNNTPINPENPVFKKWGNYSFFGQSSVLEANPDLIENPLQGIFTTDLPDSTYLDLSLIDKTTIFTDPATGKTWVDAYRIIQKGCKLEYAVQARIELPKEVAADFLKTQTAQTASQPSQYYAQYQQPQYYAQPQYYVWPAQYGQYFNMNFGQYSPYAQPQPQYYPAQTGASSSSQPAPQSAAAAGARAQTKVDFTISIPTGGSRFDRHVQGGRTALAKFLREALDDNLSANPGRDFGVGRDASRNFAEFMVEWNTASAGLIPLSVEDFLNKGRKLLGRGPYQTVRLRHVHTGQVSDIIIGGQIQRDHLAFHG